MKIWDRATGEYTQEVSSKKLRFLYNKKVGRFFLKFFVSHICAKMASKFIRSSFSRRRMNKFIKNNEIDLNNFEDKRYKSYNDVFTRKLKSHLIDIDYDEDRFIAPADSKLSIYPIKEDLMVNIKDSDYTLNEMVENNIDLTEFSNGLCLIFRLSAYDYHRYCYVDSGSLIDSYHVKGKLHTVQSISDDYEIYKKNSRVVSILDTKNFSKIIQIEVGAMAVGRIINHPLSNFEKGEEKGFFELNGSTIVILVKDNVIKIDDDILEHNDKDIETKVRYGEGIASKISS